MKPLFACEKNAPNTCLSQCLIPLFCTKLGRLGMIRRKLGKRARLSSVTVAVIIRYVMCIRYGIGAKKVRVKTRVYVPNWSLKTLNHT
jgi:hypothetical protein